MATREITRELWPSELDTFGVQHAGWIVTLEVLSQELGDQLQTSGLPLTGIAVELDRAPERIEIMVGGRLETHLTHVVEGPCRVWLREPEVPGDEAIEVECDDGTRTLVHFYRIPLDRQLSTS
jgi:hypothetical protein